MRRWTYGSENVLGNVHDAARYINEKHPEWDVVFMSPDGENGTPGSVTAVVYRIELDELTKDPQCQALYEDEDPDEGFWNCQLEAGHADHHEAPSCIGGPDSTNRNGNPARWREPIR